MQALLLQSCSFFFTKSFLCLEGDNKKKGICLYVCVYTFFFFHCLMSFHFVFPFLKMTCVFFVTRIDIVLLHIFNNLK